MSSRNDIITNKQSIQKRSLYILNNMSACSDIGLIRKRQEDSVLLLNHPLNNNFQLLALADGMGGLNFGDKASNLALYEIIKWFEQIPEKYFYNEISLLKELNEEIKYIDDLIRKKCGNGGTTLSLTIITKNNTIFMNVGDSRIYITNKNKLFQVSIDHSITWNLYSLGKILRKEHIKFHRQNNLITSHLGCEKPMLNIDSKVYTNNDYEKILLFSDGVTDCLDDNIIENIINTTEEDILSSKIVDKALSTTSINNHNLDPDEYYEIINGGKDNATAATYTKKLN